MTQLGLDMGTGRRAPRRGRGAVAVLLAVALVAGLGVVAVAVLGPLTDRFSLRAEDYPGPGSGEVVVEVPPGASVTSIGEILEQRNVVASVDAFTNAAADDDRAQALPPGSYRLREEMAAADAVSLMVDPASRVASSVTVPEGLRLEETLAVLAESTELPAEELRAALSDPQALGLPDYAAAGAEGFLFPATYDVGYGATATDVLASMVQRYEEAAGAVGLQNGARPPYETVVIASLIEGEANRPEDYAKVARVVENRLARGMPLQFDSTVNYALNADKELVTLEDLKVESAYNTYENTGLPPGPINSPGEEALRAALAPAEGDWLYFVTTNPSTGETKFTADYEEFLRFKAELQRNQGGS